MCFNIILSAIAKYVLYIVFAPQIFQLTFDTHISPKERDHWEDQGVGGKMGSEWILGRLAWGVWIGFDCLRTATVGGLL
jgi:hypothetical protein